MAKALNIPTFSIFSPWVPKEGWDLFSDEKNVAVHLKDFKPGWFEGKGKKRIREEAKSLYEAFEPLLFEGDLQQFLEQIG